MERIRLASRRSHSRQIHSHLRPQIHSFFQTKRRCHACEGLCPAVLQIPHFIRSQSPNTLEIANFTDPSEGPSVSSLVGRASYPSTAFSTQTQSE